MLELRQIISVDTSTTEGWRTERAFWCQAVRVPSTTAASLAVGHPALCSASSAATLAMCTQHVWMCSTSRPTVPPHSRDSALCRLREGPVHSIRQPILWCCRASVLAASRLLRNRHAASCLCQDTADRMLAAARRLQGLAVFSIHTLGVLRGRWVPSRVMVGLHWEFSGA
jgi:hypothetical protein|eukprot:COSAG01_NODE_13582_length_1564_cov_4.672880_1_plen_170_part_00